MHRPVIIDLFCGSGGAGVGYSRAGFHVVGIDHQPQPHYPFEFHQIDWLSGLRRFASRAAVIHASPPCQFYSRMSRAVKTKAPDLIDQVRDELAATSLPFVIENVEGAPLKWPVMLCGTMFGLKVRRHRLFEVAGGPLFLLPDCMCRNGVKTGRLIGHRVAGSVAPGRTRPPHRTEADRRAALGCEWMSCRAARQAIPPAYTEFIGRQLVSHLSL